MPDDVPGFTEELMNESADAVDTEIENVQEQVQDAVEEAGQSLPEDVPQ